MQKIISICLLAAFHFISSHAQEIGSWQVYPSYMIATQNVTADSYVYGLQNGNLLRYDTDDQSVELYNSLNYLSDVEISYIAYSSSAKLLVIAYSNGNIDLLDADNNVWNLSDLKNSTLTNKDIQGICIEGSTAYVCTGFGFLELDLDEKVIADTYNLGQSITGVKISGNYIYACTTRSVMRCLLSDNAKETSNWQTTTDLTVAQVQYAATDYNQAGGYYWHSDGINGLKGYTLSGTTYTEAVGPIQPNSPVRDLFYRMHYDGEKLLVAGGINTPFAIYNTATAMIYEDGTWSYMDEETVAEEYPQLNFYNTTHFVADPNQEGRYYASPYRTGLYVYEDGKLTHIYNSDNSPLCSILPNNSRYYNYVSAVALTFDDDGNLWMANQETDTIIRVLTPDNQWHALYYEDIEGAPTIYDYFFSTSGVRFLISNRVTNRGFFGFTTGGTLSTTSDDQHQLRATLTNQDGTSYSPDRFYCMTEDQDGQIWCGTNLGLFVIEDASTFFDSDFRFQQIKIARDDGSGLADYLLSGVEITCIAVDGANRKWIGTSSSGIYLLSSDGQEEIHHFTTSDSPLISDEIQCIAIHPTTGEVMIGTDVGLCSYMGDATEGTAQLDFDNVKVYPNPVSPDYTGYVTIDGLSQNAEVKICSVTGQLISSGTANGGRFTWNCQNKRGKRVASGVYNVIINTENGSKAIVTRIVVIK